MLTATLIKLKHSCPWLWRAIERTNGLLFGMRYPRLRDTAQQVLSASVNERFRFSLVEESDVEAISQLLTSMPEDYLKHFNPHPFDADSLRKMLRNDAFVMMKAEERLMGGVAGYFFLRGFVVGRAFHGLVASRSVSHQGLGTEMWRLGCEICERAGIDMYATICRDNMPSLSSVNRALNVEVVKDLPNNYVLLHCHGKQQGAVSDIGDLELAKQA